MAGLWLFGCATILAADFQGADAVLKQLEENRAKSASQEKAASPVKALTDKLAAYRTSAATLPPKQAAEQWLALLDTYESIPPGTIPNDFGISRLSIESFLMALPPSSAWDDLAAEINARAAASKEDLRKPCFQILAAILRNDTAGCKKALDTLRQAAESSSADQGQKQYFLQGIEAAIEELAEQGDTAERITIFERSLSRLEKKVKSHFGSQTLKVPNLVKIVGQEKALAYLRRVLVLEVEIDISDRETQRAAARLATQMTKSLKKPTWSLVQEIEDAPLYEALAKRFPELVEPNEAYSRVQAASVYLTGLIVKQKPKDAAQFLESLRKQFPTNLQTVVSSIKQGLVRQGLSRQARDFFEAVLSQDPSWPAHSDFIELSAELGESDHALKFLRELGNQPNLRPALRSAINQDVALALLAADQTEEGLRTIRAILQTDLSAAADDKEKSGGKLAQLSHNGRTDPFQTRTELGLRLAELGRLLNRPELIDEGSAAAKSALPKFFSQGSTRSSYTEKLAQELSKNGRAQEAEAILVEDLLRSTPANAYDRDHTEGLATLAALYHLNGRHEEVIKLLDRSPDWRPTDLGSSKYRDSEALSIPLLFIAGKALAVAGKKDEARRVVERLLESQRGYDPAYALLLELGGADLESRLDVMSRRDRFEERPLIWKATLQFNEGRLDDAEKTIRAAIAIDPSDGEQGKGDRMRAYSVLADILEKKGDTAQAKIMRGAVEAIRLSEQADDWWEAGLLTRAVKMYEEALQHFADAYCIQSRLALRYSELGDFAKAEQHYQRAFELMPDSFGRIESHCFGCEGAFSGERAQNVADRVFTQLATHAPVKAQVFYLLGYLRRAQDRPVEAAAQFRAAVKADPDYFNAWESLTKLAEDASLPQDEIETAIREMLRLDPNERHHSPNFDKVRDLQSLWDAVLAAEKAKPPITTGPLYSLAASAAALAQQRKAALDGDAQRALNEQMAEEMTSQMLGRQEDLRSRFIQHPSLTMVARLLQVVTQME